MQRFDIYGKFNEARLSVSAPELSLQTARLEAGLLLVAVALLREKKRKGGDKVLTRSGNLNTKQFPF